jgi:hypothetical protein
METMGQWMEQRDRAFEDGAGRRFAELTEIDKAEADPEHKRADLKPIRPGMGVE